MKRVNQEDLLVLVVDGDESICLSMRCLIRSLGYRAEGFRTAREFLISGKAEETACLVVELRMPEVDGFELQRHLVDAKYVIPIIFVSDFASQIEEDWALKSGAIAFLRKPVSGNLLSGALDCAIHRNHAPIGGSPYPKPNQGGLNEDRRIAARSVFV